MKKVGIITLMGSNNYGNRLQNYALEEVLKSMNVYSETYWEIKKNFLLYYIKQLIKRYLLFNINNRNFNIGKFSNKYINIKYCRKIKDDDSIDYYIVGSDQVWNTRWALSDNELLKFTKDNKKISYAASIGLSEVNSNDKKKIKQFISNFRAISVREESAKKIIQAATGRKDIEVLVDPTMLLSSRDWEKISTKPKSIDDNAKYILCYFLGNLSDDRKNEINVFAKKNNCQIINLLDRNDPYYTCSPSDFIYLEMNAFLVCTDSFHSSVFAFLFNRPFIIYDREDDTGNMSSRLDNLINKFKLDNRKYNGKNITKDNLEHDYTEAYKILDKERKKSKRFLEKALEIK